MELTIAFYASIAILGAILLPGVKVRPADDTSFFDRVSTKEIQGLLAVFIIFHQTVIVFINESYLTGLMGLYGYSGILAVAFFFFCSGYGLIRRRMTDESYLKGFMKRRIFTVLVPYFICNYIYLTSAIIDNIHTGDHFTILEVVMAFFGLFLVNNQMWFAVEIMILYIIFRIVFARVKKVGTGILIMTGAVLVMITIGLLAGHSEKAMMTYWFQGEWWYNTILMFPLGMFYAYKKDVIDRVFKKAFVSVLIGSSVLFLIMNFVHMILIDYSIYWREYMDDDMEFFDKILGLSQETFFEIFFLILVITVMSKLRFDNPVLRFLGKISLETIMLNYLVIDKLMFLNERYGILVYLPAVLLGTVACASVVYMIKNFVLEKRSGLFDGKIG